MLVFLTKNERENRPLACFRQFLNFGVESPKSISFLSEIHSKDCIHDRRADDEIQREIQF